MEGSIVSSSIGNLTMDLPTEPSGSMRIGERVDLLLDFHGGGGPIPISAQVIVSDVHHGMDRLVCAFDEAETDAELRHREFIEAFNRRAAFRVRPPPGTSIPLWLKVGPEELDGWLVDISVDGLRAGTRSPQAKLLDEQDQVNIRLTFPGSTTSIQVDGEIAVVTRGRRIPQCGIRFLTPRAGSEAGYQRIVDYVMQRQRDALKLRSERRP